MPQKRLNFQQFNMTLNQHHLFTRR